MIPLYVPLLRVLPHRKFVDMGKIWIKGIFISIPVHFMLTPVYQDWSEGGSQVRCSDLKGVNVTAVGLDIRLLCYMLCFQDGGGGKNQGRIRDLKLVAWVKNSSSLASCQQLTSKKKINNLIWGRWILGGGGYAPYIPLNPPVIITTAYQWLPHFLIVTILPKCSFCRGR